jgi:hypothetical protein
MVLRSLVLLLMFAVAGCGGNNGRKPPPEITVQIMEEAGILMVDGVRMAEQDAYASLQESADKFRRPTSGTSRVYVRVYYSSMVRQSRVQEFLGWCGQMGLEKVTEHRRDLSTPVPVANPSLSPRNAGN